MTTKLEQAARQALEALEEIHVGNMTPMAEENWNEAITALREALAEQAEQEPVAQQDSDDKRLLREIFMLCEATEELEPTNDFMRGRIFEAKGIRRGIGNWYQDTFCGRSYMGEPVLNAAPVQQAEQEPNYFGLTHDHTWLSIDKKQYDKLKPEGRMACYVAPVRTKDLTDDDLLEALKSVDSATARLPQAFKLFARATIAADREKNK